MSDRSSRVSTGIGFPGLLTTVFITLKLTGYITWSWWWVLAPIWIGWAILLAFLVLAGIVVGIAAWVSRDN